jgi:zinc transport system ATP-binding protein
MKEAIISLKDISFSYGDAPVLSGASLDVHRGDYLSVVGANGAGKTTLMRIMLGLINPTSGSVELFGVPIEKFENRGRVGYIPQLATSIDKNFPASVADVVRMGCIPASRKDDEKVAQALALVSMEDFSSRLIRDLSGGQQQRVMIARALVNSPEVLVLDEPTVGLAANIRDEFFALLHKLNREQSITIVLITHDVEHVEAEEIRVACVEGGRVCYHEGCSCYVEASSGGHAHDTNGVHHID